VFYSARGGSARGGGLYNQGTLTAVNCTVAANVALGGTGGGGTVIRGGDAYGGGLFNDGGSVWLLNVTVVSNNVASQLSPDPALPGRLSGSLGNVSANSIFTTSATVTLANSILAIPAGQTNVSGTLIDAGHNLASDSSAQFTAPGSLNHTDPRLGPLANHGGATPTMALLPGSPAIDAGDTAAAPATDQRGVPRPFGSASDIGAFEFTPTLAIRQQSPFSVQVQYRFQPLTSYALSASTNLINWVSLGTATSDTNGVFLFTDPIATQHRFYRVK
jgi:hypothetical protein